MTDEIFYIGKGIGARVLKHEGRTRRGVLQNKAKVKRIQEIFASDQDGGQVVQHPEVRRIAEAIRERLDRFRAEFVAR